MALSRRALGPPWAFPRALAWGTTFEMRVCLTIGCCVLLACASHPAPPAAATAPRAPEAGADQVALTDAADKTDNDALAAVRSVHGGAGPWVVAGYRMGRYALEALGLTRGSFDLQVVHHSPREVQYSCIADGAAAATGASLGRLNLSLEPAPAEQTRTTYRNQQTGASLTLQTTAGFAQRYLNVPRARLSAAGAEVLHLPDAEIFEEVTSDP